MATAQIVFTTDVETKKKTLEKLRREGNTLKSLFQYTMQAYLQGRIGLGIVMEDDIRTPELEKDYQKKSKDFSEGKNIVKRNDLVKKYS